MRKFLNNFSLLLLLMAFSGTFAANPSPLNSSLDQKIEILSNEIYKLLTEFLDTELVFTEEGFYNFLNGYDKYPLCNACHAAILKERGLMDSKPVIDTLIHAMTPVCESKLNTSLCIGFLERWATVFVYSWAGRIFKPEIACAKMFLCPHNFHKDSLEDYISEMLQDKPSLKPPTPTKSSTYKVLHITDLHVDPTYTVGNNAFCNEPLCCRAEDGPVSDSTKGAQYWGTLTECDIPYRTLDQFFQFVTREEEVDMIIWTGDNIAHNIWEQTEDTQAQTTYNITQDIKRYFPNTPVYPIFGNHECFPADNCNFLNNGTEWLTSPLIGMWSVWLDAEAAESLLYNTYYTMLNQDLNLRIISIDTQACNLGNFYLLQDPTDPWGQLAWMRETLQTAEKNSEAAFIIGHIPPGDTTCDSSWSARYNALIERFSHVIRGQFFGHTHNDQIEVVRSYKDNSPVGTIWVAPSLTTFSHLKPSFRIFDVDTDTNTLLNFYQYRLDLDKWNQDTVGPIEWDIAYDMLSEYGLPDLSFESVGALAEKMKADRDIMNTYVFHFNSGAQPLTNVTAVEAKKFPCFANHGVFAEAVKCMGVHKAYAMEWISLAYQHLPGSWYSFD